MGSCSSCLRRRRTTAEESPLISHQRSTRKERSSLEKAADIVAAINAGKLPSQDQLTQLLQLCLRNGILVYTPGNGPVSKDGQRVVFAARDLVQCLLELGLQVNCDDVFQEFLFELSCLSAQPVHFEPTHEPVDTPEQLGDDLAVLAASLQTLLGLFVTSAAFRLVLSSLLSSSLSLLETVSDLAEEVQVRAEQVQVGAAGVTMGVDELKEAVEAIGIKEAIDGMVEGTKEIAGGMEEAQRVRIETTSSKDPKRDRFVGRVHEILLQAHQTPSHIAAMRTVLGLLHKYCSPNSILAASPIGATADISLHRILERLRTILERLASGASLDFLLDQVAIVLDDIAKAPEDSGLTEYLSNTSAWLEVALSSPDYLRTPSSKETLSTLYKNGQDLLSSSRHSQLSSDLRHLSVNFNAFIVALESNKLIVRLFDAMAALTVSVAQLTQDLVPVHGTWNKEVVQDIVAWLIPMLMRIFTPLPMPRVEYLDTALGLEAAIDSIFLRFGAAGELKPDLVSVRNWGEIRIDMTAPLLSSESSTQATSTTRTHIHLDGIRASIKDIAYFVRYTGFGLGLLGGVTDEGLVGIDVGEGIKIDLKVEYASEASPETDTSPLSLTDLRVTIPTLHVDLSRTHHWILNYLIVQPLAQRLGKVAVQRAVRVALGKVVEKVGEVCGAVRKRESEEGGVKGVGVWWDAIVKVFGTREQGEGCVEEDEEADDEECTVQTSTTEATARGIVHTTTTTVRPIAASTESDVQTEQTVIAIGLAPQVVEGGPGLPSAKAAAGEVLDETGEDVREQFERGKGVANAVVESAVQFRGELAAVDKRMEDRRRIEKRKSGWRSGAFDL